MNAMKKILLFAVMMACSLGAFALSIGEKADSAYNKENYREAIELYKKAIEEEGIDSDIYYNLGNAYYRNDNIGLAVASYERALKLDPTNTDARTNLVFVRARIEDKPEDDSAFLSNVHHAILGSMTPDAWAWTAFVLFLVLLGAVALYIFSRDVALRKTGFFGGIVLLVVFLYALAVAAESVSAARSHDRAVVIVPSTQLTSVPRPATTSADKVVTIHEGTVVEVIDSVATPDDPVSPMWYNVKINNNSKAWLRASDVERI